MVCTPTPKMVMVLTWYVIDAGVRGASRPVNATGANLHPELYHPDHIADLNGATEQANYRVYEVPDLILDILLMVRQILTKMTMVTVQTVPSVLLVYSTVSLEN